MARRLDDQELESRSIEVIVDGIGARGDGLARRDGTTFYIAAAATGDRLRIRPGAKRGDGIEAEIVERLTDGPDRVPPPCRYFGECGGCQLQHVEISAYLAWKRELIVSAFRHQGLEPKVAAPLAFPQASRRRAKLVGEIEGARTLFGFNARRSRRVVDIDDCLVLAPALARRLPALRAALPGLMREGMRIEFQMLALGDAVELVLIGGGKLDGPSEALLKALARDAALARIAWRGQATGPLRLVAEPRVFAADFAGVAVEIPPGAFLQASVEAETAMRDLIRAAIGRAKRVADLYSGCGSFAAPLAKSASVHAVEQDEAACRALDGAARARPDLRLSVERRDLERRPLLPIELAAYDAVIFDPPRGGAAPQAKQLARSEVPLVVAVSCSPATLARDARLLVDGGYRLDGVQPIDQFHWTAHVEAVAVFRRGRQGV